MSGQPKQRLVRVQLDFPEERLKEIDDLIVRTGMTTRKNFFDNAISLMKWAVRESAEGNEIASVSPDGEGYRELVMPPLEAVKHEKTGSQSKAHS